MQLLVGDIGGTKVRFAQALLQDGRVSLVNERTFVSADFARFDLLLAAYLNEFPAVSVLSLGVAGPIQNGVVHTTNLPWLIDAAELKQKFHLSHCLLLNDLEAVAYGLPALDEHDLCVLQSGKVGAEGNQAVIAAGTGLGEAGLFWDGRVHHPFATEGGHASFAARNECELALLSFLQQRYGHVSWERLVSGMGIRDIYAFLRTYRNVPEPAGLSERMAQEDMGAVIAEFALNKADAICEETMSLFVTLYAIEAGNLALKMMSRGGLFIGGGIAPKILPWLQAPQFMTTFLHKGRMSHLLADMPVKIILNDRVALLGPALLAHRVVGG